MDDGCYMIANKHAAELVKQMRRLVATIVWIFSSFQLSVNMAKGKTEVMLALRGKKATAEREKLRGPDGLWLDIDDDERQVHCKVHIVSEYKHLGTWVSLRLTCARDAKHKEDQAMASYSPLAVKVFGNKRIRIWLKMALMRSLVLSRACFNLHISVPGPWILKRLNRVHMRVLRRISRCINGVETDGVGRLHQTNRAVRQMLGEPSIDCIAARARLKYWRRVMKSGPPMLRALVWNKGRPTKWALQVRKDLEALACQVPGQPTLEELSRTAINSTDVQWDSVVRELFWDTSCVDPERHVDTITSSSITCVECIGTSGEMRQFMSVKALLCHQRMKHGYRNPMRFFADGDGC